MKKLLKLTTSFLGALLLSAILVFVALVIAATPGGWLLLAFSVMVIIITRYIYLYVFAENKKK